MVQSGGTKLPPYRCFRPTGDGSMPTGSGTGVGHLTPSAKPKHLRESAMPELNNLDITAQAVGAYREKIIEAELLRTAGYRPTQTRPYRTRQFLNIFAYSPLRANSSRLLR